MDSPVEIHVSVKQRKSKSWVGKQYLRIKVLLMMDIAFTRAILMGTGSGEAAVGEAGEICRFPRLTHLASTDVKEWGKGDRTPDPSRQQQQIHRIQGRQIAQSRNRSKLGQENPRRQG
ncbi:hypothetical protein ATANTOWER_030181 [Ataeniobius toweri]|uniref:Uncharacterized protein n=1 Tax=Ataeniobius toweri TaxID=208326 RepID=A0ABU7BIM0_9TELE|nr:hypothetical protein [Ataeniobius toweri]